MCVVVGDVLNALRRVHVTVRVSTCMSTHQYKTRWYAKFDDSPKMPQHPSKVTSQARRNLRQLEKTKGRDGRNVKGQEKDPKRPHQHFVHMKYIKTEYLEKHASRS